MTGRDIITKVFATHDFYEAAAQKRDSFDDDQSGSARVYDIMMDRLRAFAPKLAVEGITRNS